MLPPSSAERPAALQQMMDQRRGGRLAVGAGDGDERRIRRERCAARGRTARCRRSPRRRRCCASSTDQCGSGWVSGTPGASTSAATFDQSMRAQIGGGDAGRARPSSMLAALSSKAITSAPPATSACALASPEPPSPNTATVFPAKARDRDHRSFSVASPASASTIAMIQNRITICGSVQPSCSK